MRFELLGQEDPGVERVPTASCGSEGGPELVFRVLISGDAVTTFPTECFQTRPLHLAPHSFM